jgi:hypothetical protein
LTSFKPVETRLGVAGRPASVPRTPAEHQTQRLVSLQILKIKLATDYYTIDAVQSIVAMPLNLRFLEELFGPLDVASAPPSAVEIKKSIN